MAKISLICWQEIPSSVEVRDAAGVHKVQLSQRFMELIDAVAMRRQLTGSDDYLAQWRKQKQPDREGDGKAVACTVAAELEARYDAIRAAALERAPA